MVKVASSGDAARQYESVADKPSNAAPPKLEIGSRRASGRWTLKNMNDRRGSGGDQFASGQIDREPKPYTAASRFYYKVDTMISRRKTQIGLIFAMMIVNIGVSGVALFLTRNTDAWIEGTGDDDTDGGGGGDDGGDADDGGGGDADSVGEHMWVAWSYMADPGTHADVQGLVHRALAATTAIIGIFFMSIIFGVVVDTIREKVRRLKKREQKPDAGRGRVA